MAISRGYVKFELLDACVKNRQCWAVLQANVLLTDEGRACLCDFGLSSMFLEFHDSTFYTSSIGGNARWAAPEIYRITAEDVDVVPSATTQSDVYSLGSIMLEVGRPRQIRTYGLNRVF